MATVLVAFLVAACSTTALPQPPPPIPNERYAAIVMDARNGNILYRVNADQPRHPASLTKMMTAFMLFEALDQGRIEPHTRIVISDHARARPPSRLGFRAGETIDVDTAIAALLVRSANDVAAAVAEHLGGSEPAFAAMMTERARRLGLGRTVFRNASGLPDPQQITTARDMALLAIALRQNFPHHYHHFGRRDFEHEGRRITGHNDLIGRVPGVDGLKTGFIRASGYNLASSAQRGGRSIVAVVMGGESAQSRNEHMAKLIEEFLPLASTPSSTSRPMAWWR